MQNKKQPKNLTQIFNSATHITITKNNEDFSFFKGDEKFECIFSTLIQTTNECHEMPAFAVSLDKETISAKQKGTWLELKFESPKIYNEMPFDALLFEVLPDYQGINIIRKNNGTYDGRCFYLNLKSDMKNLSNSIDNILN